MVEKKPKILYVDDEPINLHTFKAAFQDDFEVVTAESGEEGMIVFGEHVDAGLAVVISDQRMPGMSGVDFLVRVLHENPMPIRMILTAYADFKNVSEAVNKGQIYQFIQKPWDFKILHPMLNRAVEVYLLAKHNQQLLKDLEKTNHKLLVTNKSLEAELLCRENEEERRRAAEILMLSQAKLASLGEMATGLAHEINQPLSFINVVLQAARKDFTSGNLDPDEFVAEVKESLRQVSRISRIIDHLRTFGRADTHNLTSINLDKVVNDSLIPLRQRLKLADIELSLELEVDTPPILGSATKIEQVLINLIVNAIDALEFTSEKHLFIRLKKAGKNNVIEVEDNGSGIIDKHINKVFEPFFTTKEVGKGTGVGLAIVYGIIKEHKGTVTCRSDKGKRTKFKILLPQLIGGRTIN